MVKDGVTFCDVCSKEIPVGEKFFHYAVVASEGPVGVHVCTECRMHMHGPEMQTVPN